MNEKSREKASEEASNIDFDSTNVSHFHLASKLTFGPLLKVVSGTCGIYMVTRQILTLLRKQIWYV
jgi:hypothetical protein